MNHITDKILLLAIRLQVCLIGMVILASCNSSSGDVKPEKQVIEEPPAVEVISVQKGKLSSSLQVPGELVAYQQVDLYAKENSFVKKLYVDVGSDVRRGQLLASLEAPELNSKLAEAQSQLRSREAIYQASRASYDRLYETSKTPGTISPNDLEQAAAIKNSQLAQLQAARFVYNQVAETRNYLEIRAPFDGIITSRNIDPGAYVGPSGKGSDTPLFVLQQQKRLRLVVSVPESYAGLVRKQDEVSFTVKSLPHQQFKAKINRLGGSLDNRLRSEHVEMDVVNNDKRLMPGMYAEVNLPLPARDSTFVVPKSAVVTSTEKVFVVKLDQQKAVWVEVEIGREAEGKMEIYGDLNPGDHLIKVATDEIRNGSTIKKQKLVE
ncbi:MAG: efflux RND transporter periplasmic adaptor subunit [Chitinophagaceae bacterium]